jgi:hypothetical protein
MRYRIRVVGAMMAVFSGVSAACCAETEGEAEASPATSTVSASASAPEPSASVEPEPVSVREALPGSWGTEPDEHGNWYILFVDEELEVSVMGAPDVEGEIEGPAGQCLGAFSGDGDMELALDLTCQSGSSTQTFEGTATAYSGLTEAGKIALVVEWTNGRTDTLLPSES